MQPIDMSRFCILKKFTQKLINRVDKVVWEMLKHTHIVKQCELEEQDEEQDSEEVFYTLPESPSRIITVEECFEFEVYGQQPLTTCHAKLMVDLHEQICHELYNPIPFWTSLVMSKCTTTSTSN
jgi:hypothetical protein